MQIELSESHLPAKLVVHPGEPLDVDEFWEFCVANPDLRLERTAEGEIVIVPPAGGEGSNRNYEVILDLGLWARRIGRGKGFDSSGAFRLPNGAVRSPDAAWISDERVATVSKEAWRRFAPVVPDFVIEVMSPSDRLRAAQAKMEEWIANGVLLGWLIHGDAKTVYIYKPNCPVEEKHGITELEGEGPVAGLVVNLTRIWAGM